MKAPPDELCFMFSLHGTALAPDDLGSIVDDVDAFFDAAGLQPTHLQVGAPGFGRSPLLFERARKRVRDTAPQDVEQISVWSYVEGWEESWCDWVATCDIFPLWSCFQIGAALGSMPDAGERLSGFVRRHVHRLQPDYGYGFSRPRGRGPSLYSIGLSFGDHAFSGPEYEEGVDITRWGHTGRRDQVWQEGVLRDVYPYNLLTARQLERDIDGRSLGAWIRAGRTRGRLEEWPGGYALWTVPAEHLERTRHALAPTGALFVRRGP